MADDDNEHSNRETLVVRLLAKESNSSLGYKNNRWEKNIRLSSQGGSGGKGAPIELIDVFLWLTVHFPMPLIRLPKVVCALWKTVIRVSTRHLPLMV